MLTNKEDKALKNQYSDLKKDNLLNKNNTNNGYKEIFNNLPLSVYIYDKNGIILDCNNEFLKIIGTTKNKIIGLDTLNNLKNEEVIAATKDSLTKGDGFYNGYYSSVTGTGEIYAKGVFKGTKNSKGEIIGGVCTIEDVSEQHEHEKKINDASYEYKAINDIYVEQNKELITKNKSLLLEKERNLKLINEISITEQNYRSLFNNSSVPMMVHLNGEIVLINDEAIKFLESTKENLLGKNVLDFIQKQSIDKVKNAIIETLKGGNIEAQERKFITLKGNIRDVLANSSLFIYNNEKAILVIFSDITDNKKNQEKLNVILKGIETSPASVVITDIKGNIEYVNPTFTEVTGYSNEESLGKNPRILKSGIYKPAFYKKMWEVITSGESWKSEMRNKKKNGSLFWEHVIISPIENDEGKITNYIAIKQDITTRKEIENKLIKNEKYFKTLFETAPDGIFEINKKGVITNCNKEFALSIEATKEKIINKHASIFIKDAQAFQKLFVKLIKHGNIESELTQQNLDGSTTIVWRKVSAIYDKDNNFTGALIYNRDISNIKKTEQLLINAKNKAEESDKLKSAFLSNMSHEIRTPLNAIIGLSKLISKDNIKSHDKSNYINYIDSNSKLLLNLINDIIDISKIEANQLSINQEKFDLNNLFYDLEQIYLSQIKETNKDIKLVLDIPNLNIIIKNDELRLKQILINLISNAVKFTEFGTITFGYNINNNILNLFVKDTGIGIPNDKIHTVFNRFVRMHNVEDKQKGTGLGLSIVERLVGLLKGEITIKSELGYGTEFNITFKYCSELSFNEKVPLNNELLDKKSDWSNKTILIAEDDEFNFIVLNELLKEYKLNTIHAVDGIKAVNLYKEHEDIIDLVLMDIQMPNMDGYKATEEILKINKDAKIIIQTAFAMSDDKQNTQKIGCVNYMTKPIDTNQLNNLLTKYL